MKSTASRSCPRCGDDMGREIGSLSRADNDTEVCSLCGSEEAWGQHQEREITAMASVALAPRGVLPAWVRYCKSNPPMVEDLLD